MKALQRIRTVVDRWRCLLKAMRRVAKLDDQPSVAILAWLFRSQVTLQLGSLRCTFRPTTFDTIIMDEILVDDSYRQLQPIDNPHPTIIDLGAQIGVFSLYIARRYPDAKVYSVEATSANFALLERNIRDNELQDRVTPIMAAAWSRSGETVIMSIRRCNTGGHTALEGLPGGVERREAVPTATLAEIMDRSGAATCDLLKVDIEGAEYEVLMATPPEYLAAIGEITMEAHDVDSERTPAALASFLERHGFEATVSGRYIRARNIRQVPLRR